MALRAFSATTADHAAEIALSAATLVAVFSVAATLPAVVKREAHRKRLTAALVIATGGAIVTFVAYLAFELRCSHPGCSPARHATIVGISPWWRRKEAWQWAGQLLLASVALTSASLALALSARGLRGARLALFAARALYAVWALLAFLVPLAVELLT